MSSESKMVVLQESRITAVVDFFFNDTATTEIYTLSLHDALPICTVVVCRGRDRRKDAGRYVPLLVVEIAPGRHFAQIGRAHV